VFRCRAFEVSIKFASAPKVFYDELRIFLEAFPMLERRIESIKVRNYRSLADVEVQLEDLTVLVGENGSGKSNLVDVLRFVRDALTKGLDAAIVERGGITQLLYQHAAPQEIEIKLELRIGEQSASYHIIIDAYEMPDYTIKLEHFIYGDYEYHFRGFGVVFSKNWELLAQLPQNYYSKHNLLLPLISSSTQGAPIYQVLSKLGVYHISPERFRAPQSVMQPSPMLDTGTNMLSSLQEILAKHPRNAQTIAEFLSRIVPSIVEENPITVQQRGVYLTTSIQHENGFFDLSQESDGTLRVLGILTALYQMPYLPLIGIEEPEMMIHPQAMSLLCDALKAASARSQIVITTHSPDLISLFPYESLRIVELIEGGTKIDRIREANIQAINKKLFSGGDLLRIGALGRAE
jgi:predicted ATPase